jgi:hypothetical protein
MLPARARAAATAVALVGALVLPIAGCGTDKKAEYAKQVQTAANEFRASVEKAGAQVRAGAGLKARVPGLVAFRASVDKLAGDLAKLDPPANLKRANGDAVKQLRTLSADLTDYEAAAKAGDALRARKIVPKLQADQAVLQKTLDQIDRNAG